MLSWAVYACEFIRNNITDIRKAARILVFFIFAPKKKQQLKHTHKQYIKIYIWSGSIYSVIWESLNIYFRQIQHVSRKLCQWNINIVRLRYCRLRFFHYKTLQIHGAFKDEMRNTFFVLLWVFVLICILLYVPWIR